MQTRDAEASLVRALDTKYQAQMARLLLVFEQNSHDPQATAEARKLVEDSMKQLPPKQQETLGSILNQPSAQGRDSYVEKVIGEAAKDHGVPAA